MAGRATDPGVFIHAMAGRGHIGGLAWSTPQALRVLDAAGCDVMMIETVGVGAWRRTLLRTVAARGDGIEPRTSWPARSDSELDFRRSCRPAGGLRTKGPACDPGVGARW